MFNVLGSYTSRILLIVSFNNNSSPIPSPGTGTRPGAAVEKLCCISREVTDRDKEIQKDSNFVGSIPILEPILPNFFFQNFFPFFAY